VADHLYAVRRLIVMPSSCCDTDNRCSHTPPENATRAASFRIIACSPLRLPPVMQIPSVNGIHAPTTLQWCVSEPVNGEPTRPLCGCPGCHNNRDWIDVAEPVPERLHGLYSVEEWTSGWCG
jgi:hypothetical protein